MNHLAKRSLSMLMALVLIVSLFSGVALPASAASYTYNWGYRGQTATSLSSAAISFYSGTSYEELSSYTGSSSTSSVPSSALYSQLKTLMVKNHKTITSYDDTRPLFQYTDCQGGGGKISSFYSGKEIGPEWDGGSTWNREHTWPNSKGEGSAENDIMMLRPTASSENSSRGNTAYGISSGFYDPNSESGGTYNLHGDVARIMLYVYVRWGNTSYMWGSSGVMESKDVLLAWMEEDPVDTWELGRNDAVQSITGTRNVFVDYPELAFLLFDEVVPANMTTPSGMAGASNYAITASSNDTTMGTVSVTGKNIQAIPAEGYLATGYEIVSGTATVNRNGNTFVVNATSDCEIRILFAPKVLVNLTYLSNGQQLSTEEVYNGDPITLPEYTGTAPAGCKFLGWVDAPVSSTETRPAYYRAGESYTVNGATNIYALFSYTAEGGTGSGIWTLVTDASVLSAGTQVVITVNDKGTAAGAHKSDYLSAVPATFSDDLSTIPTLNSDVLVFTLGGSAGAWTLSDSSGNLLGSTATKSVYFNSGVTTWSISISDSTATIQNTSYGPLQYNPGYPRFTTYTSSQTKPQLYMLDTAAGSTFYTTSTCAHENTKEVAEQAATCTANGYTAGVYCNDCGTYISGHEVIVSPGHSYSSVVTPPTVTEDGYTTHTCGSCGDSYTDSVVPALGETYTVSFSVPADAAPIEDMGCNTSGITLPAADELDGYTFLGWTTAAVEDTTVLPAVYEAGSKYVATESTTLYALYTYAVGGSGETGYVLATKISDLNVGDKVIIASSGYNYAMTSSQGSSTNNRGQVAITKNADNTITFDASSGVAIMELHAGTVDGTYAFYCPVNGGYLYAASSSSNNLKIKSTLDADGSFKIEMGENGACDVTAQGDKTRNMLRHNNGNGIFSCYGSGQVAVCFYVETTAGEVYYTTEIAHQHSGTHHPAVAATCTSAGNVEYWSCSCGMNFSDSSCTQVLSSTIEPQKEHSFTAQNMDAKYLKSEANCQSAAVYYLSCASCGASSESDTEVFTFGSTNAYNHPGEGIFSGETPATCTTAGSTGNTVCAECGEVMAYGTVISATGHADAEAVSETISTCKTNGVKFHYHCDDCGGDYLEKTVSAVAQTAEDLQLSLNPNNHEGGEEVKNAADATCDADGYTGDTHCVGCGEKLKDGEVIAGGHTVENGICTRCQVYGICGDNLTWTYENGTLTISGEGEMYDYQGESLLPPWDAYREQVTKVVMEDGITSIGDWAFQLYYNIEDVTIPDSVTRIGDYALSGCQGLKEITIPNSVTTIENNAFANCWGLEEITIPASVTSLGENVLRDCFYIQKATILADIDILPDGTFHSCYNLTEAVIPGGITAIGDEVFYGCSHLESFTVPAAVTSIGKDAFNQCGNLKTITFAGSAPAMAENAFSGVTATAYYIPDATWVAEGVKQNYGGTINWVANITGVATVNGVGYETLAGALAAAQPGDTVQLLKDTNESTVVIPEGVTLDLGDHSLTADYIFGVNGSYLTATPNSGKLIVPKGQIVLGENGYINENNQYVLPIWDAVNDCYLFSLFVVNTDTSKNRGLDIDEETEKIYFQFKHQATKAVNHTLLADGASDNELSVVVRLEWTNAQGTVSQDFCYNDNQIGMVTGSNDYTFTLTGYSVLNINLETLRVTAMVVTESGATAFGTTWTQANAK